MRAGKIAMSHDKNQDNYGMALICGSFGLGALMAIVWMVYGR